MGLTEIQKIKKRVYMKKLREENKEKYRKLNRIHKKTYLKKNPKKSKEIKLKYIRQRFHCLFCNKSHLVCNKTKHKNTIKHKKNVLKFNNILKKKIIVNF